MKIYLDASKKGKVILRVKVESLLKWSYEYVVNLNTPSFKGESKENIVVKEHFLGTPEYLLKEKENCCTFTFTPLDDKKKDYKVKMEWFYRDENENQTTLGECLFSDKEKPISGEIINVSRDIYFYRKELK